MSRVKGDDNDNKTIVDSRSRGKHAHAWTALEGAHVIMYMFVSYHVRPKQQPKRKISIAARSRAERCRLDIHLREEKPRLPTWSTHAAKKTLRI